MSRDNFFLTPHPYAVGNRAEEIFYALLLAKREGLKVSLHEHLDSPLLHGYQLTNSELIHLESPYFCRSSRKKSYATGLVLSALYLPLRSLSRGLFRVTKKRLYESFNFPRIGVDRLWVNDPHQHKRIFSWAVVESMKWANQMNDYEPPSINTNLSDQCWHFLKRWGICETDWFVCWHVRDSGFRKDKGRREHRNSDIKNSISAIKEVTRLGGWVIRLGDSSMAPLPKMENVIDYPFLPEKSDLMDLFLISKCRLYVGTPSGPMEIAILFARQMLILNMYDLSGGTLIRDRDRGLPRHVYCKSQKRFLGLKEVISLMPDLLPAFCDVADNYEMVENTPEEIKLAVIESLTLVRNSECPQSHLQKLARLKIKEAAKTIIDRENYNPVASKIEEVLRFKYKSAARLSMESGAISDFYLNRNWDTDTVNQ